MQQRAAISGATRTGGEWSPPHGLGDLIPWHFCPALFQVPQHTGFGPSMTSDTVTICSGQNFLIVKLRKPTDQMNSYSNSVSWKQGFRLFIMWLRS